MRRLLDKHESSLDCTQIFHSIPTSLHLPLNSRTLPLSSRLFHRERNCPVSRGVTPTLDDRSEPAASAKFRATTNRHGSYTPQTRLNHHPSLPGTSAIIVPTPQVIANTNNSSAKLQCPKRKDIHSLAPTRESTLSSWEPG